MTTEDSKAIGSAPSAVVITPEALLEHWQGHRRLTRRVIEAFQETVLAFDLYEGVLYTLLLYVIDNEIHHRGQGYVYLRALGTEPPHFYER